MIRDEGSRDGPRPAIIAQADSAAHPRVLLVDHEPLSRTLTEAALRAAEYVVHPATSGSEVLQLAQVTRPQAILLSLEMPDLDFFETCRQLKAHPLTAEIPVIVLMAAADVKVIARAFAAGAVAMVPTGAGRLLRTLELILARTAA